MSVQRVSRDLEFESAKCVQFPDRVVIRNNWRDVIRGC